MEQIGQPLPFRLGTTSYIIEANLVDNAAYLSGKVNDMELVLFDLPDGTSNLITPPERDAMAAIAAANGLTYSVHLPLDLSRVPDDRSIEKADKVLSTLAGLPISAVVAHLDDWVWRRAYRQGFDPFLMVQWQRQACQVLTLLHEIIPTEIPICLENLESFPPEAVKEIALQQGCGLCLDVGHLWKFDYPQPMRCLADALPYAQVLHLHGCVNGTDHQALDLIPPTEMDFILKLLIESDFHGILTMEVFGEYDFERSNTAIHQSLERITTA